MSPGGLKTLILCLIFQAAQLTSACEFSAVDLGNVTLNETQGPEAGVLKTITVRDSNLTMDAHIFQMNKYTSFNDYFSLSKTSLPNGTDVFKVTLTKVINLDSVRVYPRGAMGELPITIVYNCTTRTQAFPVFVFNNVVVFPVDNYPPHLRPDYSLKVLEDVAVGQGFANLRDGIQDDDYPDDTQLVAFRIDRLPDIQNDGGNVFNVSNQGDLFVTQPLDWDLGIRHYSLSIAVTNNKGQVVAGVVPVTVLNVNDNPVLFQGCSPVNCTYTLHDADDVPRNGLVAVDADGEPVEYHITNVIPATERDVMVINKTAGTLRQIHLLENPDAKPLTLTIKATTYSILPIARNKNEKDLTEAYYTAYIYISSHSCSVSGSDRVLSNGLLLPGCLTMIYGIFIHCSKCNK